MRNRQLPFLKILSTLLFAAIVLVGRSTAPAQESARDRANSLRIHLSQVEGAYAESVVGESTSQTATIKVDILRLDLRTKLETLSRRSTSSEAVVAIYRADAESTLDAIRAYEKGLGQGVGEETTFMNVLSDQELQGMRGLMQTRLDALTAARNNSPLHHLSTSVEFRFRELEGWVQNLDTEIARRARIGQANLKAIRSEILVEDARSRYPAIGKADGIGREQNFQQRLALQVNSRLHTVPDDAALAVLRDELPKIKNPDAFPPTARGPPKSIEEGLTQLRTAQIDELTAVSRRDALAIARARAKMTTNREWLRLAFEDRPITNQLALSETSTEELINLRKGWQEWYAKLIVEQQSPSHNGSVDLQINEAKSRIGDLDAVIKRRPLTPPPAGGDFGPISAGTGTPSTPRVRAFARTWDGQLAHNELTELAKLSNDPGPVPNIDLKEASRRALRARITAQARSIRDAYDETLRLQREVLISGRDRAATESGGQIRRARKLIQAGAEDLRASLADPAFANDLEVSKAVKSLADIPPTKPGAGANSLDRGLIELENARDAEKIAVQPRNIEIQAVANSKAPVEPAYRITLPPMPADESPNPLIRRPAEYADLHRGRQTLTETLKDLKRAPGGVIIDAKLPAELAGRLKRLEVDVSSGAIKVLLDDSWRTLKMRGDPLLVRLAWAFVSDEQIAVIDLRPLERTEALWLFLQYGDRRLPPGESNLVVQQVGRLTSVNVNDALRDTSLVPQLIAADQLMFDLLPRSAFAVEGEDERYGLPLRELRLAFRADAGAELNRPNWQDVLFNKSILTVSEVRYEEGPQLILSPKLSFNLFGVPARGPDAIRLPASEHWFAVHEEQLKALEQLRPLCEFATLVALFRSAKERGIPHNLDDLIAVLSPPFNAPRFIVRRDRVGQQKWEQLKSSLTGRK